MATEPTPRKESEMAMPDEEERTERDAMRRPNPQTPAAPVLSVEAEQTQKYLRDSVQALDSELRSWRRVAEQLESEKVSLRAQVEALLSTERVFERAWAAARGGTDEYREGKFDLDHAVAHLRERATTAEQQVEALTRENAELRQALDAGKEPPK